MLNYPTPTNFFLRKSQIVNNLTPNHLKHNPILTKTNLSTISSKPILSKFKTLTAVEMHIKLPRSNEKHTHIKVCIIIYTINEMRKLAIEGTNNFLAMVNLLIKINH